MDAIITTDQTDSSPSQVSNPGQRLAEIRREASFNQINFGKLIGIHQSKISRMEKGEDDIPKVIAIAIEHVFNVNRDWLRKGLGEKKLIETVDDREKKLLSFIKRKGDSLYHVLMNIMAESTMDGIYEDDNTKSFE